MALIKNMSERKENILIEKLVAMNLSEGMYKLDEYITDKLTEQNKVKTALRECENFNNRFN